jgi:uncharacterized protein involved in exopolysaccharide biosynthesis
MDDFSPFEAFTYIIHRWWIVACLVILGGVIGWMIHLVEPPRYDATATFGVAVDLKQAGPITTLEQDKSIDAIEYIILSDAVEDQVLASAKSAGINLDLKKLQDMSYLNRKSGILEIRVRNSNPMTAQTLVNAWADLSFAALKVDNAHALQVDALTQQLNVLSLCMQAIYLPDSLTSLCQNLNPGQITSQYQQVLDSLNAEKIAAHGLPSWVLFSLQQKAGLPTQPVAFNTNILVLAGGLIGFILGIWMVIARLPDRLSGRIKNQKVVDIPTKEGRTIDKGDGAGTNP